jgi:hypothetical protein
MAKHVQDDPEDRAKVDGQLDPGTIIGLEVPKGRHVLGDEQEEGDE